MKSSGFKIAVEQDQLILREATIPSADFDPRWATEVWPEVFFVEFSFPRELSERKEENEEM